MFVFSGLNEAAPPVDIDGSVNSAQLAAMMGGVSLYSDGAGGFGAPLAIPSLRLNARMPASPASASTIAASTLYGPKRTETQQRISG